MRRRLALLFREPGHELVAGKLATACMSTVNLTEVLSRFARDGKDTSSLRERLEETSIDWITTQRSWRSSRHN